ncbi:MAG: hypothetical protein WC544_03885 [Patescibacteria group bacterium]
MNDQDSNAKCLVPSCNGRVVIRKGYSGGFSASCSCGAYFSIPSGDDPEALFQRKVDSQPIVIVDYPKPQVKDLFITDVCV